ncbi:hypothetical protein [Paenibacillus sp. MMO-177]|uniref:hypothetical protein n=1 Tax=Paenibacillus sp. MMO-177 TaxID=3081289 RepID=UPI0030176545
MQNELLIFALCGSMARNESIVHQLKDMASKLGIDCEIKGYQEGSGVHSLGRHLLTSLAEDVAKQMFNFTRTEVDDMYLQRNLYQALISQIKNDPTLDYNGAVDELLKIAKQTQAIIRSKPDPGVLYRQIPNGTNNYFGYSGSKIFLINNILSSYSFRRGPYYRINTWSDDLLVRKDISIDRIIIHPRYLFLDCFGDGESEVIVFNPDVKETLDSPKDGDVEKVKF